MGIPILLRNDLLGKKEKVYNREKYIFNVSLVIEKSEYMKRKLNLKEMVRKIIYFFTSLEVIILFIYLDNL